MELITLDRKVLRFIRKKYPRTGSPESKIVTVEEFPLATEADVCKHCHDVPAEQVQQSIKKLKAYGCIREQYLASPKDFIPMSAAPGDNFRVPLAKRPEGINGYQITNYGAEVADKFLYERAAIIGNKAIANGIEKYGVTVLVFLLGMLISAIFGFDIKQLFK